MNEDILMGFFIGCGFMYLYRLIVLDIMELKRKKK